MNQVASSKKLVVLSNHVYSSSGRKASIHFLTDEFRNRGYDVSFITVGVSRITRLKRFGRYLTLRSLPKNSWIDVAPGLRSYIAETLISPVNLRNKLLNTVTDPIFSLFGRVLPRAIKDAIGQADVVLIDSGSGVCFFDKVRSLRPDALIIYNAADLLGAVGVRPSIVRMEERVMALADVVRLASPRMMSDSPGKDNVVFAPHGIDKHLFDVACESPYAPGTRNMISVGSMLFDQSAIEACSAADDSLTIHVFGAPWKGTAPANVKLYNELPFSELVPYIKFADSGIAPYRVQPHHAYLVHSSLKVKQYTYCHLPILLPDDFDWALDHACTYTAGDYASIKNAVAKASSFPRSSIDSSKVLNWAETLDLVLASRQKSSGNHPSISSSQS